MLVLIEDLLNYYPETEIMEFDKLPSQNSCINFDKLKLLQASQKENVSRKMSSLFALQC